MMTFLKGGKNKVPLDRLPSLAKARELNPAHLHEPTPKGQRVAVKRKLPA